MLHINVDFNIVALLQLLGISHVCYLGMRQTCILMLKFVAGRLPAM